MYPWQELFAPANIPNWVLCAVGVFTVGMALRTLRSIDNQVAEMKAQTTVGKASADAANLNAQAVIEAERAWIFAELGTYAIPRPNIQHGTSSSGDGTPIERTEIMNIKLTCKNQGKTPAWIDAIHAQLDIVDSRWQIEDQPVLRSVRGKGNQGTLPPIGAGEEQSRSLTLVCDGYRKDRDEFLSIYGVIEYHDIFGKHRETVLAYSADENNLVPQSGVPGRNRHT